VSGEGENADLGSNEAGGCLKGISWVEGKMRPTIAWSAFFQIVVSLENFVRG
jgi:hypothetical protein